MEKRREVVHVAIARCSYQAPSNVLQLSYQKGDRIHIMSKSYDTNLFGRNINTLEYGYFDLTNFSTQPYALTIRQFACFYHLHDRSIQALQHFINWNIYFDGSYKHVLKLVEDSRRMPSDKFSNLCEFYAFHSRIRQYIVFLDSLNDKKFEPKIEARMANIFNEHMDGLMRASLNLAKKCGQYFKIAEEQKDKNLHKYITYAIKYHIECCDLFVNAFGKTNSTEYAYQYHDDISSFIKLKNYLEIMVGSVSIVRSRELKPFMDQLLESNDHGSTHDLFKGKEAYHVVNCAVISKDVYNDVAQAFLYTLDDHVALVFSKDSLLSTGYYKCLKMLPLYPDDGSFVKKRDSNGFKRAKIGSSKKPILLEFVSVIAGVADLLIEFKSVRDRDDFLFLNEIFRKNLCESTSVRSETLIAPSVVRPSTSAQAERTSDVQDKCNVNVQAKKRQSKNQTSSEEKNKQETLKKARSKAKATLVVAAEREDLLEKKDLKATSQRNEYTYIDEEEDIVENQQVGSKNMEEFGKRKQRELRSELAEVEKKKGDQTVAKYVNDWDNRLDGNNNSSKQGNRFVPGRLKVSVSNEEVEKREQEIEIELNAEREELNSRHRKELVTKMVAGFEGKNGGGQPFLKKKINLKRSKPVEKGNRPVMKANKNDEKNSNLVDTSEQKMTNETKDSKEPRNPVNDTGYLHRETNSLRPTCGKDFNSKTDHKLVTCKPPLNKRTSQQSVKSFNVSSDDSNTELSNLNQKLAEKEIQYNELLERVSRLEAAQSRGERGSSVPPSPPVFLNVFDESSQCGAEKNGTFRKTSMPDNLNGPAKIYNPKAPKGKLCDPCLIDEFKLFDRQRLKKVNPKYENNDSEEELDTNQPGTSKSTNNDSEEQLDTNQPRTSKSPNKNNKVSLDTNQPRTSKSPNKNNKVSLDTSQPRTSKSPNKNNKVSPDTNQPETLKSPKTKLVFPKKRKTKKRSDDEEESRFRFDHGVVLRKTSRDQVSTETPVVVAPFSQVCLRKSTYEPVVTEIRSKTPSLAELIVSGRDNLKKVNRKLFASDESD